MLRWWILSLVLLACVPAHAEDYGFGASPTLGTAISIGNDVMTRELGLKVLRRERPGTRASGGSGRPGPGTGASPFRAALQIGTGSSAPPAASAVRPLPASGVETRFTRTPEATQRARENILNAIAQRQPSALGEFRGLLDKTDLGASFRDVTQGYDLRDDDIADVLTAYWAMGWVVANKAPLPAPEAAVAVRAQIAKGLPNTMVAQLDEPKRQIVTDELIFNFLVLNGAWRNERNGGPNFAMLSDATQQNFQALGTDLRGLALGPQGFATRR